MARYSGKKTLSEATREEGMQIAQSTQRPGQTKEQTKLIAQGIQRGIDLYKKQQKAKARELDRKLKRAERGDRAPPPGHNTDEPGEVVEPSQQRYWLPWSLLALTWLGIGAYVLLPWMQALRGG